MIEVAHEIERWRAAGESVVLATVVRTRGSTPRGVGAALALTPGGAMAGSVSGGCIESDVVAHAASVFNSGEAIVVTYGIADELGFEVGLSCGGEVDVLIERLGTDDAWERVRVAGEQGEPIVLAVGIAPAAVAGRRMAVDRAGATTGGMTTELDAAVVAAAEDLLPVGGAREVTAGDASALVQAFLPRRRLVIVGATHVGMVLSRLARELGMHVTVIDPRGAFATPERFPDVDALVVGWPDDALTADVLDAHTALVLLTHDPKFDRPALAAALGSPVAYIGAMSSRATHAARAEALRSDGWSAADVARIHAPIGLDLGGRAPEEIALAIVAELVAVRYGRDGRSLSRGGRVDET